MGLSREVAYSLLLDTNRYIRPRQQGLLVASELRAQPQKYVGASDVVPVHTQFNRIVSFGDMTSPQVLRRGGDDFVTISEFLALVLQLEVGNYDIEIARTSLANLVDQFKKTGDMSVVFFDMDEMSALNGAFSHIHGSLTSSYLGHLIADRMKPLGGIVVPEGEENILIAPTPINEVYSHVLGCMEEFTNTGFLFSNEPFRMGVSAGMASIASTDDKTFWRTLELAGGALVYSKKHGKGRSSWFKDPIETDRWSHRTFEDQRNLYEKLYMPDEVQTGKEAAFVLSVSGMQPGQSVIDVCCGSGRHAFKFAKSGMRSVGLDRSGAAISDAKRKIDNSTNPRFYTGDAKTFYRRHLDLLASFDLATVLFSSFGYDKNHSDVATLVGISQLLKTNGKLFLDLPNKDAILNNFKSENVFATDIGEVYVQRSFDIQTSRLTAVTSLDKKELFKTEMTIYTHDEITLLLEKTGFTVTQVWSDFQGNLYDANNPDKNPRLLVLAAKSYD